MAPEKVQLLLHATTTRIGKYRLRGWFREITKIHSRSISRGLGLHDVDAKTIYLHNQDIVQISGPTVSFQTCLDLPDDCIRIDFERWLDEARKLVASPVARPGRKAHNGHFDDNVFARWRSLKIIEYAQLLYWRAELNYNGHKTPSNATLGQWVGRYSSKDVYVTEQALKRALKSLPAMLVQIGHEESRNHEDHVRKLLSARISKQISH